jgi:hypothetical protein
MSGYAEDLFRDRACPSPIDLWLLKPVSPDTLLAALTG